jgi:integral membrane sensor domain MASE1
LSGCEVIPIVFGKERKAVQYSIDSLSTYVNIFLFLTLLNALLSRFAVVKSPLELAPGVSGLYFAVSFMVVFALWYGIWGALSAYLGCMVGAGILANMPLKLNIVWSLADLWQVLIPLAAFAYFKADIGLKTKRDFVVFLVFGVFINNLVGALWGSYTLFLEGMITWAEFFTTFAGWFLGNIVVAIILVPFLLRYITPYIRQTRSYVDNLST